MNHPTNTATVCGHSSVSSFTRCVTGLVSLAIGAIVPARGQVAMHPASVAPASMERFAVRVASISDTTTGITLTLPDAISVLAVERHDAWSAAVVPGSDTAAARIVWSAGTLAPGEFREFAFFGRLAGDVRRKELVFPVTLERGAGEPIRFARNGGDAAPPVIRIVGSTAVSAWGALGLAGAAVGIAIIALGLALSRGRGAQGSSR